MKLLRSLRSISPRTPLRVLSALAFAAAFGIASAQSSDYADIQLLMRSGKHAEALAKTEQYISEKPRDPMLRFLKGVIQTDAGKPADAMATFTALTQDYPELPEPYNNLAALYAGQNQYDKARVALEMAVRLNPTYAVAHENLGDVYARMAGQSYSKALQLDAANPQVPGKLNLIREIFVPKGKAPKAAAAK